MDYGTDRFMKTSLMIITYRRGSANDAWWLVYVDVSMLNNI